MESRNRNVWIIVVTLLAVACCGLAATATVGGWVAYRAFDLADSGPVSVGGPSQERIEKTFEVGDAPRLRVENFAGAITVRSGPDGAVHVVATKRANSRSKLERIQLTMSEQGDGLLVRSRMPHKASNTWVELEITAPADSSLVVNTGAGAVNVRDIAGPHNINSGAGEVNVRGAQGPIQVRLGAGQISYEGRPSGNSHLITGAGEVRLWVPEDLEMKVDLNTGIGLVRTDFDVDGLVKPRHVRGVIGDGSQGSINAQAGAGEVSLSHH
jgi:hypothetical protein